MSDEIQDRLTAALAERYAVEQPLGEGGMALVYLARDVKHDRLVAVKVLRPDLAASIGSERFLREIHVTAKLSHPHILPLYDSGDAEGLLYYVMPFVEGESLADMLAREKQLSIDDAVRITKEVAEALGHAHSYGLIHRDIKPDNVMMSGTHAIVADFGIAKALSDAGGSGMTQTGTSIGTPAYMSPEQAAGLEDLDGRTDIYALGCMLYEMLVGQVPFTGPTPQAIMARHTMDQIPPPSIMRDSVMPELEDVIFCAMAKSPADRFRTAQEMIDALTAVETGGAPKLRTTRATRRITQPVIVRSKWKRLGVPALAVVAATAVGVVGWQFLQGRSGGPAGAAGGLDPTSVAVLYFDDLSPDGELGQVADGLTEALIGRLSEVRALDVISRNGVAPYRESVLSPDSIARALGAGSLITGAVEPTGDQLRVTVRLVDGTSGVDIERTSFQLAAAELLAAQDSVALRASSLLRQRLGEEVRVRERRAETSSVEAWTLVQRAERLRKDAEGLLSAGQLDGAGDAFARADSVLALAEAADREWVGPLALRAHIAFRRARTAAYSGDLPTILDQIEVGLGHANRALARAPNHARALEQRGTLKYLHWLLGVTPDPADAEQLFNEAREDLEAAVRADPTLATAHGLLSHLYINTDDQVSMLLAARRAYEEDAYLADADQILNRVFFGYYNLGQFADARHWCDEGLRRFPGGHLFLECQLRIMMTEQGNPDADRAWELVARLEAAAPEARREYWRRRGEMFVGGVIGKAGDMDSARTVLVRARGDREIDPNYELAEFEAAVRTMLGDYDEAIELLKLWVAANPDQAFEAGESVAWWWEPLTDHPGFRTLLAGRP
jgi:serine/threonine-protein kinase